MKHLFTLAFLVVGLISAYADVDDDLIFYLPLDGDTIAAVGPDAHTYNGTVLHTTDNWGNAGGAVMLTGDTNSLMYVWDSLITDLPLDSAARTIACWVRFDDAEASNNHIIAYGLAAGGDDRGKHCHLSNSNNGAALRLGFWWNDFDAPNIEEDGFVEYRDSSWHHVAATFDGEAAVIYLDGVALTTTYKGNGTIPINTVLNETLTIGGANNNQYNFTYKGAIDEVRIYNVALDEDDIMDIYEYIPEVTSTNNKSVETISFYPNPANSSVTFTQPSDVALYNLAGKLVLSEKSVNRIDVSALSSGLYFIKVNGQVSKLVIK